MAPTRSVHAAIAALATAMLSGCGMLVPFLPYYESGKSCRVAVEEKFDSIVLKPNPFRQQAASAVAQQSLGGAAMFADITRSLPSPDPILLIPGIVIGAIVGAVQMQRCSAEMLKVPNAEVDFGKIVEAVGKGSMKRFVLAELDAQRPECARTQSDKSATSAPDAAIEITKLVFVLGCGGSKQGYEVGVEWRGRKAPFDGAESVYGPIPNNFMQISSRGIAEWLARPDQARLEIERVLAKIAQVLVRNMTSEAGGGPRNAVELRVPFPGDEMPNHRQDTGG